MKTLDEWMGQYAESHQNPTNQKIHKICVPAIMFSILGLLWVIPTPFSTFTFFNWAFVLVAISLGFYARLSVPYMAAMALVSLLMLMTLATLEARVSILWLSVVVFVVAWIGQFIGHKIEGKKPSFFEDLQFLLIGPLWVLHFLMEKNAAK